MHPAFFAGGSCNVGISSVNSGRDACKNTRQGSQFQTFAHSCTLGTFVASRRLFDSRRSILQVGKLLNSKLAAQVLSIKFSICTTGEVMEVLQSVIISREGLISTLSILPCSQTERVSYLLQDMIAILIVLSTTARPSEAHKSGYAIASAFLAHSGAAPLNCRSCLQSPRLTLSTDSTLLPAIVV